MQAHISHQASSSRGSLVNGIRCTAPARLPVQMPRYTACHSTPSSSAAATAAAAKSQVVRSETPKWFGFDTETCGIRVLKHEVIALAAYDLDSGEAYTALINPALHNPNYKFGAEKFHGLSRAVLEQQGVSCQQAFDGLVSFVNSRTPPGHTPALVAHNGFAFHFPIMEAALLRSAHATAAPQSPARSSTSSSSDITSNSPSRRRRQKRAAPRSNAELSCSISSSGGSGGSCSQATSENIRVGWPSHWLFHDTLLLARCLAQMQAHDTPLRAMLSNGKRGALAKALLPGYSEAGVTPQERAFADAASAARLSAVLLGLLEVEFPPKLDAAMAGSDVNFRLLLQQRHAPWLSKPWPLDAAASSSAAAWLSDPADAPQLAASIQEQLLERFPGSNRWGGRTGKCGLEHCPRAMQAAAVATLVGPERRWRTSDPIAGIGC